MLSIIPKSDSDICITVIGLDSSNKKRPFEDFMFSFAKLRLAVFAIANKNATNWEKVDSPTQDQGLVIVEKYINIIM